MNTNQILGIVAVVVGTVLVGFAYHASNAPLEQISNTMTGRYTDSTMWYLIVGIAAVLGGGLLTLFGRRAT